MVRYIHPGNETLLAALNAAGVKVDLSSFLDTTSKNALRVVPEVLNSSTGGFSPWAATSFGGVLAANVAPFGDQASQFAQRPLTFDAQVQLRTAGAEYDARDTSDRAAREVGRVRPWGNADIQSLSGELTAPGANVAITSITVPAGGGDFTINFSAWAADTNSVGKRIVLVHRNAGNTLDIKYIGGCAVPGQIDKTIIRYPMGASEILVARTGAAGAASSVYGAFIQVKVAG